MRSLAFIASEILKDKNKKRLRGYAERVLWKAGC
jgi:hypothetical protein